MLSTLQAMASDCIHHPIPQPSICELCAAAAAKRGTRNRRILALGAPVLAIVAIITYLETRPARLKPPPEEPDVVVRNQRARLAKTPCDLKTRSDLVGRLIELQRWEEALPATHAALGCGVTGRMKWNVVAINQHLHRWFPTAVAATELINEDPLDSDFWWWRGEAWADGHVFRAALADDRQSLASSSSAQPAGFAAARIWVPAKALGETCEAARAWRYFGLGLGGALSQDMRDETAAMVRTHACDKDHGTGSGELVNSVHAIVEGISGSFLIDPATGTTVVTRMFAAKVGLESTTTELGTTVVRRVPVMGEPLKLKRVLAAGVAADNIDALVVDELPPGVDGVLGLSFLWHFDFVPLDGGARVSPPSVRTDL